jgi:hypothetical protein
VIEDDGDWPLGRPVYYYPYYIATHHITMPSAYPLLPADPPTPYVKPTLDNTHGGKTYKPTHPELFRVDFTSSIDGQEGFASRLVAERVCPATCIKFQLMDRTSKQENGSAA